MLARLALVALLIATPACADPANDLKGLGAKLHACFAGVRLSSQAEATVQFSLKRDGSLNGKPRLAYARFPKDERERADDAAALARALNACLPIAITDALGGAIAGRPLTFRIVAKKPETAL